jgi:hypothetical protein
MARASAERTLRGRVAVIGIGETDYHRHGASPDPEFKLALKAILAACADAASIRTRSMDFRPMAKTAATRRGSRLHLAFIGCVQRRCNGAEEAAGVAR